MWKYCEILKPTTFKYRWFCMLFKDIMLWENGSCNIDNVRKIFWNSRKMW